MDAKTTPVRVTRIIHHLRLVRLVASEGFITRRARHVSRTRRRLHLTRASRPGRRADARRGLVTTPWLSPSVVASSRDASASMCPLAD